MSNFDELSEKERAFRVELSKRTISMPSRSEKEEEYDGEPEHIRRLGEEVQKLIREERLETASEKLDGYLAKYPDELGLLNLKVALNIINKQFGGYDIAKETCVRILDLAISSGNKYYTCQAINNFALIAQKEGLAEYSKTMYLAAHAVDPESLPPMLNLAGWHSRNMMLDDSMEWIDRIVIKKPDWMNDDQLVTFFLKDEMFNNLRTFRPFREKILEKIEK